MLLRSKSLDTLACSALERVVLDLQLEAREALPVAHPSVAPLQAADQLVEAQLLQGVPDGRQLAGAQLDQGLALAEQGERLVEARLAGVQAPDDLLDPGAGLLVGELALLGGGRPLVGRPVVGRPLRGRLAVGGLLGHRSRTSASISPSAKRSRSSRAARAAAASVSGSPAGEKASA